MTMLVHLGSFQIISQDAWLSSDDTVTSRFRYEEKSWQDLQKHLQHISPSLWTNALNHTISLETLAKAYADLQPETYSLVCPTFPDETATCALALDRTVVPVLYRDTLSESNPTVALQENFVIEVGGALFTLIGPDLPVWNRSYGNCFSYAFAQHLALPPGILFDQAQVSPLVRTSLPDGNTSYHFDVVKDVELVLQNYYRRVAFVPSSLNPIPTTQTTLPKTGHINFYENIFQRQLNGMLSDGTLSVDAARKGEYIVIFAVRNRHETPDGSSDKTFYQHAAQLNYENGKWTLEGKLFSGSKVFNSGIAVQAWLSQYGAKENGSSSKVFLEIYQYDPEKQSGSDLDVTQQLQAEPVNSPEIFKLHSQNGGL